MDLWTDFETASLLNLKNVGLDRYAKDPSTRALMLAYAFDDGPVSLWEPHMGPMPQNLSKALQDPSVRLCAWNSNFERDIFEFVLGIPTDLARWYDPSVLCLYMGLPMMLSRAGDALNIVEQKQKTTGKTMFSAPSKATKKLLAAGSPPLYFKDWNSHPEEWKQFGEYCMQDVLAEREVHCAAVAFNSPMTAGEHAIWMLSERMNNTGVYIDQKFVTNGKKYAEDESNQLIDKMKVITGLKNPNSQQQMLGWLVARKYPYDSIDVEHIDEALTLKYLPPDVVQILELKQKLGGSAYKKFQSIQDRIGPDGRLRDQFVYHKAHTGRWAGRGVQLQNLFKPDKDAGAVTPAIVAGILANDLNLLDIVSVHNLSIDEWNVAHPDKKPKGKIKNPIELMTAVASVIRASFAATPGHKLVVGDLAQIESRVLAALAGCQTMIDLYAGGHDLYKEFMAWLLKKTADEVDSDERARGKIVILGCGFGMGVDKFIEYAATFGITLSREEAEQAVFGFREKYPEIPALWYDLNNAVMNAVRHRNCVYVRGIIVDGRDERVLKIKLPSGRYLHYHGAYISWEVPPWGGKARECVSYTAFDAQGTQLKRLYGGLITENIVQAIARDILANGMLEAEAAGATITMTIHDEVVCEVLLDSLFTLDVLLKCMTKVPEWGKNMNLILAAECWEGLYYKK